MFDQTAVLKAVTPLEAIERVRDGFVRHAAREWEMPAKTYLLAPPNGDFRAMPARGSGLAMLKWICSFPVNPAKGMPAVMGVICVSNDEDGRPLALIDAQAVTALRTGAVAAIAAQELAREDAASAGIIGCGVFGSWAARCLAAAEYGPGVCFDPDPDRAGALAGELGWEAGSREDALGCDIVTCVTPGHEPVIASADLRPGMHLNMLGADGPGKAEADDRRRCALPALLRRVGAGLARRRADGRDRGRARDPGRRDGDRRGARPACRQAAGRTRRSRCSTRPGSRSRTWRSAMRCSVRTP